jgi:hypothetical protein
MDRERQEREFVNLRDYVVILQEYEQSIRENKPWHGKQLSRREVVRMIFFASHECAHIMKRSKEEKFDDDLIALLPKVMDRLRDLAEATLIKIDSLPPTTDPSSLQREALDHLGCVAANNAEFARKNGFQKLGEMLDSVALEAKNLQEPPRAEVTPILIDCELPQCPDFKS